MATHSRVFLPSELQLSRLELKVRAVQETLSKVRHISAYCGELEIMASDSVRELVKTAPKLHPELLVRVIDIRAYKPKLRAKLVRSYPVGVLMDSVGDWQEYELEDVDPELQNEITQPALIPRGSRMHTGPAIHVLFDGGSQNGAGTAGFVIIDSTGAEVIRVGEFLGQGVTNNEAEATALSRALYKLDELRRLRLPNLEGSVRVFGDS